MNKLHPLYILNSQNLLVGRWYFEVSPFDGFGALRNGRFGHVRVIWFKKGTDAVIFEGEQVFGGAVVKSVFLHYDQDDRKDVGLLASAFARASGLLVDPEWPLLRAGWPPASCACARLNPLVEPALPEGYLTALSQTQIDIDVKAAIAALETRLEQIAENSALESGFTAKYGVRRILTAGSTSRQTYLGNAVDFDLLIQTEAKQMQIARKDIRDLVDRLVSRVKGSTEFLNYVRYLGGGDEEVKSDSIRESFFGVRGKESFVARYQLILPDRNCHVFDITFGHLLQVVGYEIWIQRYFKRLGHSMGNRIRQEIRLAKSLLSQMDNLYGVGTTGFRGHIVEQFIIQGANYRWRGSQFGCLANSLELIVEEFDDAAGNGGFEYYKNKFPLWHPGWWESEAGLSDDRPGVNLWNLLGQGDCAVAEQQWRRITALALSHADICNRNFDWTVSNVVSTARKILKEDHQY